jgi:hypothetical protein
LAAPASGHQNYLKISAMTTPEKKSGSGKLRTLESLTVEIEAYESAIADAELQGRGKLPQVELLRKTLGEMRARLQILKQAEKK